MKPSIDLSIVICTHDRYDTLADSIASIEIQDCAPDRFELIVVDNSSDKVGRQSFMDGLDISCNHTILIEDVAGLSRARNIGARAAIGKIVAFMDDDARAVGHWASRLIETFDAHPQAGIAGGPVRPIWPTPRPTWLHPWLEGYLTIVDRGAEPRALAADEWLAGTNIAFRREPLLQSGLFNENLGRIGRLLLSNEELSVSARLRDLGFEARYDPQIEMYHRVHRDRMNQAWMRRRVFWQVVSDLFAHGGEPDGAFSADVSKVLDYLMKLPAKERGLAGLFRDVDDAGLFHEQTAALSTLIRLMATDGRDWRAFLANQA